MIFRNFDVLTCSIVSGFHGLLFVVKLMQADKI